MLSKCANPACDAPFHYLREGKLFQFDLASPVAGEAKKPPRRIERFWLCGRCAETMTVAFERSRGLVVVPLKHVRRAAAS